MADHLHQSVYATTMRNQAFNRETAEACQELLKEGVQMRRMPDDVLINFLNEWEKIQAGVRRRAPCGCVIRRADREVSWAGAKKPPRECSFQSGDYMQLEPGPERRRRPSPPDTLPA